jgi:dTDP-4-dehydrorhamnose 3,5-epimerase
MTFRDGPIDGVSIRALKCWEDARGWLIELYRDDELQGNPPAMAYVSQTLPGVARGPHEHRRQWDRFYFVGPGRFKLYLWDARPDSPTRGTRQTLLVGDGNLIEVLIPPGVVHAYQNTSDVPGVVLNFPDQLYAGPKRSEPVDEIRYEGLQDSPYQME